MNFALPEWAFACGKPIVSAVFKEQADDFSVDEVLGFEPDGSGDHAMLQIRKRDTNTEYLARKLAGLAGVRQMDVGYCGLKDRRAVTTQWFTVNVAGLPEPDWTALEDEQIQILMVTRHRRKLRRGSHVGNQFRMTLHEFEDDEGWFTDRLNLLCHQGVPNYFGPQRFGSDNLRQASIWLSKNQKVPRHRRSLYLSVGRSLLFNAVLSERVRQQNWNQCLDGDVLMLDGTHSHFGVGNQDIDDSICSRIESGDLHPTGPLWGKGESHVRNQAAEIENAELDEYRDWCHALEQRDVKNQRRALRVNLGDLQWEQTSARSWELTFLLPAGSYATAVLRECVQTNQHGTGSAISI